MRKRNELERMKMMRKDEERRREELVRLLWKLSALQFIENQQGALSKRDKA